MKKDIVLFGVSCVGKTTIGKALAEKLNYKFYDIDEEIKRKYKITLEEFVKKGTIRQRDSKRCKLAIDILGKWENIVLAVTPLSYPEILIESFDDYDVIDILLVDSPDNIFNRLIFSDENDVPYLDDEYKNEHKEYYLKEIKKDLDYYGFRYRNVNFVINVNGDSIDVVTNKIIELINDIEENGGFY